MVGRLLDQYNLSMDEVDIREEICVLQEVPTGARRRMPIDGVCRADRPVLRCEDVVCEADDGSAVYCFYGFEPDVAMAVHLFIVVAAAVRAESASFKATKTYGAAETALWRQRASNGVSSTGSVTGSTNSRPSGTETGSWRNAQGRKPHRTHSSELLPA
jgi:hypothetical protein